LYASAVRAALIAAFPPAPLTPELIHAPDARWVGYEEREALTEFEGRTWTELPQEVLERHGALLIHAGGEFFARVLPAYLVLLAEHEIHTALPFHVASQVSRNEHEIRQQIFDERVGPMTAEQRAAVRNAIAFLATRAPMEESMSVALRNW
jgi:hypothetical protein